MVELLHLPYSPWSEKARWALELRGVRYEGRVYQPLFGELELRLRLRRLRGAVSVPMLVDGTEVLNDSLDIARWADGHGTGPRLFPPGKESEVVRYNALSERGLAAGRALTLARLLEDPATLGEQVPRALQRPLGKLAPSVAAFGVRRTMRKYGGDRASLAEHEQVMVEVLETLRRDLAHAFSKPATLLGTFSYADIAMAQVLSFANPPPTLALGKASRRAFSHPALSERYADLVAWRDALYEAHRHAA